ncbi:MAG: DUF268 domain-containing protein [Candidatus ainarchaeum sp.]|nr:DUF268 domain-containing protein [Candidatus ainarchaeum sp.]
MKLKNIFKFILKIINGLIKFTRDYIKFKHNEDNRFKLNLKETMIIIGENTKNTEFSSHYIYHTAWAARKIKQLKIKTHIDISSSLYFVSIISAFIKVKYYDYRPIKLNLKNISSNHADLTKLNFKTNTIQSLSCMHVVEHIGLGRYGDPIDPKGDLKAIKELKRVISKKGNLFFVVPIGNPKIIFNAHRIYSYNQIMSYFKNEFKLKEFSLITDTHKYIQNSKKKVADKQNYGCGCFWFVKK